MEEGRPRSSLSLASSASTISSLGSLSTKKSTRAVSKVHAFGKRSNALRRDPNLPVHIRGWLHKQDSSGLRLWKRRWFVLSGHCLFYYKDSREESVLGSVLLPSYSIRPDGPGAPRGRRFTFTAEHPGMRTYVLAADTLEDLRGWLRALGRASRAEGDDCGQPRSPASPQPGEGPCGPGGPPEVSRGEEGRGSESPEVARLSRGRGRPGLLAPSPTADLQFGPRIRRTRSPDLFTPLSRPPSPLSLPRPRSAPARRPPPSSGDTAPSARPHTPLSRIDVRPPLDWGPQRQTLSRPPTPRRGLSSEAGGGKPPRSPQHWSQETRIPAPSSSSTYLQLPPRPPGTGASMVLLPGPPLDSTFHQSLETDTLLTKLCGQDRLLRRLQEEIDRRQEEKEQLEAALELTRQQMGQTTREAAAPGRAWGRQRLLQDRLVSVRATLCHLTQSLPESLELSSPRSPEADWGRPPGGDRELVSPRSGLGSPRVSRASSPEGRRPPSPQPGTKVPLARPRMSAQEQLERIRRNQECGRPLPRPASPRLFTLGRTLSPARRQPDAEPKPVLGHSVAQKWLRSSGSWSSPRNTIPYLPTSEGHRERVLSLSQALATEASQWHRMMTSGNVDSRKDPLPPAPPPPSDPTLQMSSPPRSPPVTDFRSTRFSRGGGGRDAGPTSWEANWDSGAAPPALTQDEGAWPLRVTLLQSSF
ncbi:pleckstrin homology domain-containing family A member 4 isoform X5 [Vicugna pacos]|uniref:Pleckstrin homology domain-containing family A member 4 isoform X5 n=1 Tax=Vicugna pacos TaxID=30538 RepID=A0A6J3AWF1_VICPA|nr:pleckstrin homology domain-containing family A member 4 isoform X4 [Vicugna pacos]